MVKKIVAILLLIAGLLALGYPSISKYLSEKNSSYTTDAYEKKVKAMNEEELEKLWREAEEYNENLTGHPVHDPFIPGSGMVMPKNYYRVLNVDGVMGSVEIPKIKVDIPIYHGTSEAVLKSSVGHLEGSTLPIGGEDRHAVITGHTGLANAKIFTDLVELEKNDKFYINVLGKTLAYKIDKIQVIEPDQTEHLRSVAGKDYVTLLTCTPYGVNSHRLLVRGIRTTYDSKERKNAEKDALTREQKLLILAAAVTTGIMAFLIIAVTLYRKRNAKEHEE